jgi:hypothetical protein
MIPMRNKPILYSTLLCVASFSLLSAAPPADRGQGKNDTLAERTEASNEKRSWVDRVLGRERNEATEAAEKRREAAEERAVAARERKESAEAKEEGKPNWVERLFGIGKDKKATSEDAEEKAEDAKERAEEARKKAREKQTRGFSDKERAVLEDWQRGEAGWKKSGKKLPPGLQKKVARGGELPPGWKKKLAVGDKLPEEYEAKAETLPEEILRRLPETEEGTEILRIGDEVIRVVENTREIIDILGIGQGPVED